MNTTVLVITMTFIGLPDPAPQHLQEETTMVLTSIEAGDMVDSMNDCLSKGRRFISAADSTRFERLDYECITVPADTSW